MRSDSTQSLVQSSSPTLSTMPVSLHSGAYNGPPSSNRIIIKTPRVSPGPIDLLDCYPMLCPSSSVEAPMEVNGVLTGYRIHYYQVTGTIGPELERSQGSAIT